MAKCYVKAFFDWIEQTAALSDAERGRLFIAILEYARSGLEPKLDGREGILFPVFRSQIDRDAKSSAIHANNGANGGRPKTKDSKAKPKITKQNQSAYNKDKEEDKDKDKDKDDTGDTPCNPPVVLPAIDGFSPEMTDKLCEWLMYKQERREGYKAIGLKNLLAMVRGKIEEHGEQAVLMRISEAMASGWVGMNLDKMPISRANTGGFADVKGGW